MAALKIDRVLVGEALVGDGNEVAHIDLVMGPRGSAAETAFCTTLTNQKVGDNALLALVRPNLMTKPATVMFNKVDIKNGDQAGKMFGPAQRGIGKAVVDSVKSGVIPKDEAANIFICVGVFIHWEAKDDAKIQDWNYQATKIAIERAVKGEPSIDDVISEEDAQIRVSSARLVDGAARRQRAVGDKFRTRAESAPNDEALLNAREALTDWIVHSRANGRDIPEPRTVDELLKDPEVVDAVMREI